MNKIKTLMNNYLKNRFIINLIFLSILFFGNCFWGNMTYITASVLLLLVLFDNLENGISYIIFYIPFCFLKVDISQLLMIICAIVYLGKFFIIKFVKEKTKINPLIVICIAIFYIYGALPIGEYNTIKLIRILLITALFFILYLISQKPEVFRLHYNVKLLCISIMIASVFSLSYYFSPYLQDYMPIRYANGNTKRFLALFRNSNVLAMFCEMMLALLAYFIITKPKKLVELLLYIIITAIGILTFSKTFILLFLLISLILLIWSFCKYFKRTLFIVLPLLGIIIAVCVIFPQLFEIFKSRFGDSLSSCKTFASFMNMITTGRYDLWVEYSTYIIHHPLVLIFGRGAGAPNLQRLSAHNAYITIVYEFGLVGTALFALTLGVIIKEFIKNHKGKIHWATFIPIAIICLILFVENIIF